MLTQEIHALRIAKVRYSSRWGTRRSMWNEVNEPTVKIPFYVKEAGTVNLNIQTAEGITLKSMTQAATKGLNYATYDLTLTEDGARVLEKSLHKEKTKEAQKKTIKAAKDNKAFYLVKGTYQVELQKNGQSVKQDLIIK